jgi:hypothetical protein
MKIKEIYWAMQHDWYYYTGTSTVDGARTIYVRDDMVAGGVLSFTDFNLLKEWAGY